MVPIISVPVSSWYLLTWDWSKDIFDHEKKCSIINSSLEKPEVGNLSESSPQDYGSSVGYECSVHISLILWNIILNWGNLQWPYCACRPFKASLIECFSFFFFSLFGLLERNLLIRILCEVLGNRLIHLVQLSPVHDAMDPISILELNMISSLLIHHSSCPFMTNYTLSSLLMFSFANKIVSAFLTVFIFFNNNK